MEKKNTFSGNDVKKNAPVKKGEGVKDMYRINERIRAKEVRLVGENVEQGIYSIQEAIRIADEQGLDLVEISIKIGILTIPLQGIYHIFKGKESSLCAP